MAGGVATRRPDRHVLDPGPQDAHRIPRGMKLSGALLFLAPAQFLGDVQPSFRVRQRCKRTGMLDHAPRLVIQALPQLRQEPVRGRISGAEQGENADRRARLQELSRQLESDRAAGAKTGDDVRAAGSERADLGREIRGEILDARERLAMTVEPGGCSR